MTSPQRRSTPRPWYCNDRLVDDYRATLRDGGDLSMYKSLKFIRSIIVNLGIIGLAYYSLSLGADPTIVGGSAIVVLGGYNGLELGDYVAAIRAYKEVQHQEATSQSNEQHDE